jgi:hypothetical protein
MKIMGLTMLLLLAGCVGPQPPKASPSIWVQEVEPPLWRYQVKFQNRGVKIIPNFLGLERGGEYMLVPQM